MTGSFIVNKVWSDGFCERYALVKWIEKEMDMGVYFLTGNEDVNTGDILNGELVIDCAKITAPMHINDNIEMSAHFDSVHDTYVAAKVLIKSIEDKNTLYGYINPDFSHIKISMTGDFSDDKLLGDEITVKGVLTLELSE